MCNLNHALLHNRKKNTIPPIIEYLEKRGGGRKREIDRVSDGGGGEGVGEQELFSLPLV